MLYERDLELLLRRLKLPDRERRRGLSEPDPLELYRFPRERLLERRGGADGSGGFAASSAFANLKLPNLSSTTGPDFTVDIWLTAGCFGFFSSSYRTIRWVVFAWGGGAGVNPSTTTLSSSESFANAYCFGTNGLVATVSLTAVRSSLLNIMRHLPSLGASLATFVAALGSSLLAAASFLDVLLSSDDITLETPLGPAELSILA